MSMPLLNHIDPAAQAISALNAACLSVGAALSAAAAPTTSESCDDDQLLTSEVMAVRMGLTATQLNRRGKELPFRVKLGWRTVRWSLRGYHKWLKKQAYR